jgi:hypothetical protein
MDESPVTPAPASVLAPANPAEPEAPAVALAPAVLPAPAAPPARLPAAPVVPALPSAGVAAGEPQPVAPERRANPKRRDVTTLEERIVMAATVRM